MQANIVLRLSGSAELTTYTEVAFVQARLNKLLYGLCGSKFANLACLSKLVADCLEPNYVNRPTIGELIARLGTVESVNVNKTKAV